MNNTTDDKKAVTALAAALEPAAIPLYMPDGTVFHPFAPDLLADAILAALRADPAAARAVAAALLTPEMLARAVHRTHNVLEAEPEPCGEDTAGVWSDRGYAAAILAALRDN